MQQVAVPFERQLRFNGCFNFRDLGGYQTAAGRRIRPQMLSRADGSHTLTDDDVARLGQLA